MKDGQNSKTKSVGASYKKNISPAFLEAGKVWRAYGRFGTGLAAMRFLVQSEFLPVELRAELRKQLEAVQVTIDKVEAALPHSKRRKKFTIDQEKHNE